MVMGIFLRLFDCKSMMVRFLLGGFALAAVVKRSSSHHHHHHMHGSSTSGDTGSLAPGAAKPPPRGVMVMGIFLRLFDCKSMMVRFLLGGFALAAVVKRRVRAPPSETLQLLPHSTPWSVGGPSLLREQSRSFENGLPDEEQQREKAG
jgi:hypothetical protein